MINAHSRRTGAVTGDIIMELRDTFSSRLRLEGVELFNASHSAKMCLLDCDFYEMRHFYFKPIILSRSRPVSQL